MAIKTKNAKEDTILNFPEGFLWGAATSSHQVEGGNVWNDWHLFEIEGKVKNHEASGDACDHYHLYKEDFAIAKSLNQNAQRISIEWSRIEKQKGIYDESEIRHYIDVLRCLKENGFTTFVTLHHFTNPIWFVEEGGWSNHKSIEAFNKYVSEIVPALDEYVDFWTTINEPTVFTAHGYVTLAWPPARFSLVKFFISLNNLAKAHNTTYKTIKGINPAANVGIVYNFAPMVPGLSILTKTAHWARNFYFMDKIIGSCDHIGVNYYFPVIWFLQNKRMRKTDLKWPIYPKGMYDILVRLNKRYNKPMYITENGIADVADCHRETFIRDHLRYIHKAISKGCNVRGYMYWSLIDNFEWGEGFTPRFGLVKVDYATQKRTIRKSAHYYAKVCKDNYLET